MTLLSTDLGSDGAGFFLASGVPQSSEDDEGRMLRALRRFVDSDLPLPVQAGCNRGHVFVAEVGAPTRAAFSAMGDTTNTAARIMSKAAPGLLYAHPVGARALADAVRDRAGRPVRDEGQGPAAARLLGGRGVRHPRGGRGRPAAAAGPRRRAGRAARAPSTAALGGEGGVVTVTGATGMGKTPPRARGGGRPSRASRALDGAGRAVRRSQLLPRLPRPAAPAARHRARDAGGHGPPAARDAARRPRPSCCRWRR